MGERVMIKKNSINVQIKTAAAEKNQQKGLRISIGKQSCNLRNHQTEKGNEKRRKSNSLPQVEVEKVAYIPHSWETPAAVKEIPPVTIPCTDKLQKSI